jgi:hypothetical protein
MTHKAVKLLEQRETLLHTLANIKLLPTTIQNAKRLTETLILIRSLEKHIKARHRVHPIRLKLTDSQDRKFAKSAQNTVVNGLELESRLRIYDAVGKYNWVIQGYNVVLTKQ